jgi:hypothetical protein
MWKSEGITPTFLTSEPDGDREPPLDRLCGPQSRSVHCGEQRNFEVPGMEFGPASLCSPSLYRAIVTPQEHRMVG